MIFGSKKLSKMVAISALSAALGAVLFTTSATASEIKYMERIAPAYRDGASANMLSLTSLEDVKNFTKNFKEEFGTIKPEIIKVPNEFEKLKFPYTSHKLALSHLTSALYMQMLPLSKIAAWTVL